MEPTKWSLLLRNASYFGSSTNSIFFLLENRKTNNKNLGKQLKLRKKFGEFDKQHKKFQESLKNSKIISSPMGFEPATPCTQCRLEYRRLQWPTPKWLNYKVFWITKRTGVRFALRIIMRDYLEQVEQNPRMCRINFTSAPG